MARLAHEHGVTVIAITSLAHATSESAREQGGPALHELADVVIDNGGCVGDAAVRIEGLAPAVGPTSTVVGAAIVNALVAEATERLVRAGSGWRSSPRPTSPAAMPAMSASSGQTSRRPRATRPRPPLPPARLAGVARLVGVARLAGVARLTRLAGEAPAGTRVMGRGSMVPPIERCATVQRG